MDVCELEKHRPPLVPAQRSSNSNSNGNAPSAAASRRPTREVGSRYKSPTPPSTPSRRCPSPNLTRTLPTASHVVAKRSQSAERRRPSTPPSPRSPSTPVHDSSASSRRLSTGTRIQESLWPSTMRSLSVSFQSDAISIPVSKKQKPVHNIPSDRTLRPSSNATHKQVETRKPTPERKRSPLKGKNAHDHHQSENAKPVDALHTRLIDQHRWPSRIGGKAASNFLNKSVDLADKTMRALSKPIGIGLSSLRRIPAPDGIAKQSHRSSSDAATLSSAEEISMAGSEGNSIDDTFLRISGPQKLVSTSLSERVSSTTSAVRSHPLPVPELHLPGHLSSATSAVRSQPLPVPGSHPPSPGRTSVSRGVSPSRTRPLTPPSRGVSPSRIRPPSVSSQSTNSTSVLSFIADFKKVKKGASYIEDAHQLRLLYNRHLQWRFANARAEAVLYIQKVTAEKTLYNVWNSTIALWDSVVQMRINLQQLKLDLKINGVLSHQMAYLDDWALLERDHISSFSGAVEDLEANTLRLPVTGGAKVDIESLKVAICSAVDVMQAMGSSIFSLLSREEGMNSLVSQLAVTAAQEKGMLDACEALLASTAATQVEEYSYRTHLIQIKHVLEKQTNLAMNTTIWP